MLAPIFALLSLAALSVEATSLNTNAERLARGLPPLPPRRRVPGAIRPRTSSTPFHCEAKAKFCCSSLRSSSSASSKATLKNLGLSPSSCGSQIGFGCAAATGGKCDNGTPSECCGNLYGDIGIDCSPTTFSSSSSAASSTRASSSVVTSRASSSVPSSVSVPRSSSTVRSSSVSSVRPSSSAVSSRVSSSRAPYEQQRSELCFLSAPFEQRVECAPQQLHPCKQQRTELCFVERTPQQLHTCKQQRSELCFLSPPFV
ncbi:hypothetical protein C8J57DRAFT_1510261 [Mycena rebaudengoi]|nr:hypothetical protein C8J57DRAFT_1510261 [Mycena rebaudengoi]